MGAVSSLIYSSKSPQNISCIILDSPFSDLRKILIDIINSYKIFPQFIIEYGYKKTR